MKNLVVQSVLAFHAFFILKTLMTDIGIEGKDLYNKNGFLSEFEIGPIQFRTQFQAI